MGIANPAQYRIPEFETFERFLFEWLSIRDPADLDNVFKPQCEFVCDASGTVMVDFVGKVESVERDVRRIETALGRKLTLPRENATAGANSYWTEYSCTEALDLVARIYRRDVEIFGYEPTVGGAA